MPAEKGLYRSRGRPRSETTRKAILSAAYRLLRDNELSAITTPVLAAEAGVSTATLYRWWPTKVAIALDAFVEKVEAEVPFDNKIADPLERLRDHAKRSARFLVSDAGRVWTRLIMATQGDEKFRKIFLKRLYLGRRKHKLAVIHEAIAAGKLPVAVDGNTLVDAIYGPLYYRLFMGHQSLSEQFAEDVFHTAVSGISTGAAAQKSSQ